jgi:N-acetylmuramoyl-L-alanine amidase
VVETIEAALVKRTPLFMAMSWTAICLCSCQTLPNRVSESEPIATPVAEVNPEPAIEPQSEPDPQSAPGPNPELAAVVAPKLDPPRLAGIAQQAERLGATVKKVEEDRWQVSLGEHVLRLTETSRKAVLDGTVLFLSEPFKSRNGLLSLSDSDFENTLNPAMKPEGATLRSGVIVIDPGHGGSEKGTTNDSMALLEKDLNLDVSLRLQSLLEALGYRVVLTRYDDRLVPLEERTKIANRSNAGIFVSVHFNAALNQDAMGLETYVLTPPGAVSTNDESPGTDAQAWPGNAFDSQNFEFGFQTHKRLIQDLQRTDRGFKRARFKVLKGLECPGILVECGFLSHSKEVLLINTPVYRQKLAESLAKSLDGFAKSQQGEKGS